MNHSEIVSFLWGVADLIRDTFKRGKYQDVILPLSTPVPVGISDLRGEQAGRRIKKDNCNREQGRVGHRRAVPPGS